VLVPVGSVPDHWNWTPSFHVPPGWAVISKVESLKLTWTQSASDASALRYQTVATIAVAVVPDRGLTSAPDNRFGPLEAMTGRTVDANRTTAAHKALTQDHAPLLPVRRSMASTRSRLPRPGGISPVHAENGLAIWGQQWYGGPGTTSVRVDGRPIEDWRCAAAPIRTGPVGSGWAVGQTGWTDCPGWLIGFGSRMREPLYG
jgi:hypothetical protein